MKDTIKTILNLLDDENMDLLETLLKIFDDAQDADKKIGRARRRELIRQIDAVDSLTKVNKERLSSLLTKHEKNFDSIVPSSVEEQGTLENAEIKARTDGRVGLPITIRDEDDSEI